MGANLLCWRKTIQFNIIFVKELKNKAHGSTGTEKKEAEHSWV